MATYIVRAELPNGFKLIVDFASEENRSEARRSWKKYYSNIGVKASVTTEKADDARYRQFNARAYNVLDKAWSELTNDEKLIIVEMMIEAI